jgi:catechol-2,3-dioxygenase
MPQVRALGHVGVYVEDVERERDLYTRVLGFTVTDENLERGMVFLSARPDTEHHEVLLMRGRTAQWDVKLIQQISFHVESLEELRQFHRLFQEEDVEVSSIVTHGMSVSIYFLDPEGNKLEVYYPTDIVCPQPFSRPIDLAQDDEGIMGQVRELLAARV